MAAQRMTAQELQKYVCLVSLSVGWPRLTRALDQAEVTVQDEKLPDDITTKPKWALMPTDWSSAFQRVEHKARKVLRDAAITFGTGSQALLPLTKTEETFRTLRAVRGEFLQLARTFHSEHYSRILQDLKERLSPALYKIATARLPQENELLSRFYMVWAILPLGAVGEGARRAVPLLRQARQAVAECQHDHQKVCELLDRAVRELNSAATQGNADQFESELVREARQQLQHYIDAAIEDMVRQPQQQLLEAINTLMERVGPGRSGKRLHQATIENVRKAFDKLKSFSFVASDALLEKIRTAEAALEGMDARALRHSAAGAVLSNAMQPLVQEMRSALDAPPMAQRRKQRGLRRRATAAATT